MEADINEFWKCRNLGFTKMNILREIKGLDVLPMKDKVEVKETGIDISSLNYEELRLLRNEVCRKMREIERSKK